MANQQLDEQCYCYCWKIAGIQGIGKGQSPQNYPQESRSKLALSVQNQALILQELSLMYEKLKELDSCGVAGMCGYVF